MRKVFLLPGFLLLTLLAACGSCDRVTGVGGAAPFFGPAEGVPVVRVALRRNAEFAPIGVDGPYSVTLAENSKTVSQGASLSSVEVRFAGSYFEIGPARIKSPHIIITPATDGSAVVGEKHYRGILHLYGEEGKITVVNHVNIEHYLASVVPAEMKISWPEAALQAQAVAARTYALWRSKNARKHKKKYDLTSGSDSQVYAGLDKESDKSRKVVVDTAGTVLTYEGEIFPAYYHSTCGGFTADAHVIFGGKEIPCLTGVPCGNCRESSVYEWDFNVNQKELAKVVSDHAGGDIGKIVEIQLVEPDAGQRPKEVVLKGEKGEIRVSTPSFRRSIGTRRMKSISFTVSKLGEFFEIHGSGWGHGVGMCQWGAAGMADPMLGFTAQEILQHYYQGAQLQRLY